MLCVKIIIVLQDCDRGKFHIHRIKMDYPQYIKFSVLSFEGKGGGLRFFNVSIPAFKDEGINVKKP